MAVDFPDALDHFLPESYSFTTNAAAAIVIHKTGGDGTLDAVYNTFFQSQRSTHYAIGLDGTIWQFVPEARGAGGNCCVQAGYDTFWDPYLSQYQNLNLCTLSVEHCDPTSDNSKLVQYWCQKYHIALDHIKSHASIDPIDRARCPGSTYDFQALFSFLQSGNNMGGIPDGWHDDGTTLTAPNGHRVVLGFRKFILTHPWKPDDMPLEEEVWRDTLEESNPALGAGSQQLFNMQFVRTDRNNLKTQLTAAQQQIATLQAEVQQQKGT